ncbi:hypothetical protein GPEL0_01f2022 [Geoanaerobacter pelophilus]|uniref:Uncharacterized protein n=1 Tax=Geoanaerobacter pelophilus TaxID=60036 RepID=A0ABQ0MHN4_9BACT|nr:hypothetical protein GPEL0_01f2022 [Geoanaerobacter pelophilus]
MDGIGFFNCFPIYKQFLILDFNHISANSYNPFDKVFR